MPASRRLLAKTFVDQLEQAGSQTRLTRSLAAYLIEQKRYKQVDMLISDIETELASRGRVLARVTTAKPLAQAQRDTITTMIKDATDARTVELIEKVEPAIIGGVRLSIPGRELDATVRKRLQQLSTGAA